ncbi:hypothetical protein GGQ88_000158 [Novosphingobium hassiacum]|uniref:Uncharacterized protein n=1 Tax=Novosphingobium hassiacum TaxID=173676 RepID=A0A7W6EU50_9SPHN|nr:hypothetical protein [Novosphingobium hassiacum]MBB3858918.1 hypothetical protein [Novosphingobium hassiacum]
MQWTPAKTVLAVAGIAAFGAAGYQMNHAITCQGLEEDFLNRVDGMKSTALAAAYLDDKETTKTVEELRELNLIAAKASLDAIGEQCGADAAVKATGKMPEAFVK